MLNVIAKYSNILSTFVLMILFQHGYNIDSGLGLNFLTGSTLDMSYYKELMRSQPRRKKAISCTTWFKVYTRKQPLC